MTITQQFSKLYPTAVVTTKLNANNDMIVYVNGQTAYNRSDRNTFDQITRMTNALLRSQK